MRPIAQKLFAVAVLLFATACASGNTAETTPTPTPTPTPGPGGGTGLTISILNQHQAAGTFVLFIEQVGGVRQSLGTVQAGTSPRFRFAATPGAAYTLIQQTDAGETNTSSRFTFQPPTTVTWDMNTRRLTVLRQ